MNHNTMPLASERTNVINNEIYDRNIPSQVLQPMFSTAPQSTKFTYMPVLDTPFSTNTSPNNYNIYSPSSTFYGGNSKAPWSGFANNVDTETELRNQMYGLQHDSLGTYIPPSHSSLYTTANSIGNSNKNKQYSQEEQQFFNTSDLFTPQKFSSFNPNIHSDEVGFSLFNNSTRQQNKNVTL